MTSITADVQVDEPTGPVGKVKRHDPMAGQMVKLVRTRPWLGWRHRRPMDRYHAARTRNNAIQIALNGTFMVVNAATGKLLAVPVMAFFVGTMLRTQRRLNTHADGYRAEWQAVREAMAEAEAARAAGAGRRLPSPRALAIVAGVTGLVVLQLHFLVRGGTGGTWIAIALTVGAAVAAGDVVLHLRHAPGAAGPGVTAAVVDDGVVLDLREQDAGADWFPIADYDGLTASVLVRLIPKLYYDELPQVMARERAGKNRRTVLNRLAQVEALLADAPDDVTAEEWTARTRGQPLVTPASA
jgi:hypothetical protein